MTRAALGVAALCLAGVTGSASAEWSIMGQVEHFKWTEPSVGVTEKGPRVGLGLGWTQNKSSGWLFAYRFKESPRSEALTGPTCTAFGFASCSLLQPASNADMHGLRLHYHF